MGLFPKKIFCSLSKPICTKYYFHGLISEFIRYFNFKKYKFVPRIHLKNSYLGNKKAGEMISSGDDRILSGGWGWKIFVIRWNEFRKPPYAWLKLFPKFCFVWKTKVWIRIWLVYEIWILIMKMNRLLDF